MNGDLGRTGDNVGEGLGGSGNTGRVPGLHDLDLDTENSLSEEDVPHSLVNEVTYGLQFIIVSYCIS